MDKIFAYIPLEPKDGIFRANFKCDSEKSVELREKYNGITKILSIKSFDYSPN